MKLQNDKDTPAWNRVEEPTVTKEGADKVVFNHPAYGQIGVSRVTGKCTLYGSDFTHHNTMRIHIARSQLTRSLSNDWPYAYEELIEIELSEAQWAAFVSTPNSGDGTQCTIRHINREHTPQIAPYVNRTEQFGQEMKATFEDGLAQLQKALTAVDELKISEKQKQAIRGLFRWQFRS